MTKQGTMEIIEKGSERSPATDILPAVQSPMEIISQAVARGAGEKELAIIERMFAFDVKVKEQAAKEAFFEAKANFKADAPRIIKDKANKQYNSMYASEAAMLEPLNPALSKHGLEVSFDFPPPPEGSMSVACILTHKLGHSQTVTLSGPLDTSGSKNPLQQVKSTATYLRKATFEAIVGIASSDADDDGNKAGPVEYITVDQVSEIKDLIKETKSNMKIFLKVAGAESIETITADKYKNLIVQLKTKQANIKPRKREPGDDDQ